MKLNLGCMDDYKKGWVNVDFDESYKAEVHHNLNSYPYPFPDNSADEILASAILEHLDDPMKAMMEFWRVGKEGCKIYLLVPHCSATFHQAELEHKYPNYTVNTFGRFEFNKELYPYFEVERMRLSYTVFNWKFLNKIINPLINLYPRFYERILSGILPCSVIVYILKVNKDLEIIKQKEDYAKQMANETRVIDMLEFIKTC